jgi:aspartokinase
MKVFKFGGASVKDAAAVRNMTAILKMFSAEELVVVISAMGKNYQCFGKSLLMLIFQMQPKLTKIWKL